MESKLERMEEKEDSPEVSLSVVANFHTGRFLLQKTAQLCKQQRGDFMKVNAFFIANLIIYSIDMINSFVLATLHSANCSDGGCSS